MAASKINVNKVILDYEGKEYKYLADESLTIAHVIHNSLDTIDNTDEDKKEGFHKHMILAKMSESRKKKGEVEFDHKELSIIEKWIHKNNSLSVGIKYNTLKALDLKLD